MTSRTDALGCWAAALAAVEPQALVARCLGRDGEALVLRDRSGRTVAVHRGPVLVVGGGKAALGMARAAARIAGADVQGGIVVVPHGQEGECPGGVEILAGAHPVPDDAGEEATRRLLATVQAADERTLVVTLLSGGASALLVAPADGIVLADKVALTHALLSRGTDIRSLNVVRKHCSRIKGGGLARAAVRAAGVWTLALSDVPDDDPATIASGPTVADASTFRDAENVLASCLLPGAVPASIGTRIARGAAGLLSETAKPGDPSLVRSLAVVVGGNGDAVAAAAAAARERGYATAVLRERLEGDAADAGRLVVAHLRGMPRDRPVAVVAGGETTVRATGTGLGGRSQHLALAAAIALRDEPGVVLAGGTDGVDGPTDAAGACIDAGTVARARACGLDPEAALAATDSHRILAATGDLLRTGPTGTNVADVVVALRPAC